MTFLLARGAWRASEFFEAVGNWLEDLAMVTKSKPLSWHLRQQWPARDSEKTR